MAPDRESLAPLADVRGSAPRRSRSWGGPSARPGYPSAPLVAALLALAAPGTGAASQDSGPDVSVRPGQEVALVTGSTSGLGREVAYRLAARGAHVIVHGRDEERGREVVARIEEEGVGTARFLRADLASLEEVREMARTVLADYDRLDLLINNAGIGSRVPAERMLSEDGYELRFAVNYLSHFLLTDLLLPRLEASAPARIINVASIGQAPIDFDDVMMENDYSGSRAYGQSKLAQIMFTIDLAERLEGTGVQVFSLHPATYMDTKMVRQGGITPRSTVDEGADAVMRLVTSEGLESGAFFNRTEPGRANRQAYDEEARARLWALSVELTGAGGGRD